jgi:hypothetical protein
MTEVTKYRSRNENVAQRQCLYRRIGGEIKCQHLAKKVIILFINDNIGDMARNKFGISRQPGRPAAPAVTIERCKNISLKPGEK